MSRVRTAVLISGRGSNLKSLIEACAAPDFPAEIVLVVSNVVERRRFDHRARTRASRRKSFRHKPFPSREAFDAEIDAALRAANVELVCEAGFMRIHSAWFAERWEGRILNIHPSLLLKFPGVKIA